MGNQQDETYHNDRRATRDGEGKDNVRSGLHNDRDTLTSFKRRWCHQLVILHYGGIGVWQDLGIFVGKGYRL